MFTRIVFSAVLLMGCATTSNSLAEARPSASTGASADQPKKQEVIRFLGLEAPLTDGWVQQKPANAMRLAQCHVPAASGSKAGEMVVYYFGRTRATLDANIARWRSQFSAPGGGPVEPTTTNLTVEDMPVTLIEFQGAYARGIGVGPSEDVQADQTMVVAVVDAAAKGLVYIQIHGPSATIKKQHAAFEKLVKGIRKVQGAM